MSGGGVFGTDVFTTTCDVHVTVFFKASTAVQLIVVVPTANNEPDVGVQLELRGAVPPLAVGASVTATGLPSSDVAIGTGQMIDGVEVDGVVVEISREAGPRVRAAL